MKREDNTYPPRFETYEDGEWFLRDPSTFPKERYISPFIKVGNLICENPKYVLAPYQVKLIWGPEDIA